MLWVLRGKNGTRHLWTGLDRCDVCSGQLSPVGFHIREWRGHKNKDTLLCGRCLKNIPEQTPNTPLQERRTIIIREKAPLNAILVIPRQPSLVGGHLSVFDAANDKKLPSASVTDRTLLSGRPDSTFLDDAAPVLIGRQIEPPNTHFLTQKEAFKLLDNLRGEE